jgi:hypothetical protein
MERDTGMSRLNEIRETINLRASGRPANYLSSQQEQEWVTHLLSLIDQAREIIDDSLHLEVDRYEFAAKTWLDEVGDA